MKEQPTYQKIIETYKLRAKEIGIELDPRSISLLELVLKADFSKQLGTSAAHSTQPAIPSQDILKQPVDIEYLKQMYKKAGSVRKGSSIINSAADYSDPHVSHMSLTNEHLLNLHNRYRSGAHVRNFGDYNADKLKEYLEGKGLIPKK